ncbi:hypothetical protein BGZ63DRAFT_152293 [Mariannaea sp. PMI_226]|nr:hypothetical protein BGZ63DRAFT_152293 [Mariannaea sp. PMI_226]
MLHKRGCTQVLREFAWTRLNSTIVCSLLAGIGKIAQPRSADTGFSLGAVHF